MIKFAMKGMTPHISVAPFPLPNFVRDLMDGLVYLAVYLCLDQFSFVYAYDKLNITPWNPPIAASVILIFLRGYSWTPWLFIAPLSFQIFCVHLGAPWGVLIAVAACEALIYTAAVWLMKSGLRIDTSFSTLRDVIIFAVVVTASTACMGIAYVLICAAGGLVSLNDTLPLIVEYWAADSLGILILAPLFLIASSGKRAFLTKDLLSWEALLQFAFAILLTVVVLWADQKGLHVLYIFFIPVIWVAVRNGLARTLAVLLVIQMGMVLSSWGMGVTPDLTIKFLPFIMLVITWVGLILGSVIDEQGSVKLSMIKSEARLMAILDMAPDSMLIVDMQGTVVAANKNFTQLYGATTPQDITGKPIETIIPAFYPDLSGETSILLANGKDAVIEVSSSRVPVDNKFSSILTVRDITSRKKAEVQLRQRRAVTEQVTRANLTGSLAAVLAHELNQPLSAIISYVSACSKIIAATENHSLRVLDQLSKVAVQAQRAGDIIRRLREFFQNSSVEISRVDISELVYEVIMLLEDELMDSQVDVEVRIAEPLIAAIDRIQIEQVLINLIKNSVEALKDTSSDQRKIRIVGSLSMRGDIEIVVTDTGSGISAEIADQLFNPFVTTRLSGMGLGLTISRSIVEAHNGRLWAETQSSSGASMHFTIPAFEGT